MTKTKFSLPVFFALFMFIATFVVSCQKKQIDENMNNNFLVPKNYSLNANITSDNVVLIDKNRELVCLMVAKSLQNEDFRKLIKNEAIKQFDGDYDVLFQITKNLSVNKKQTLNDFLFEAYVLEKGKNA